MSLKWGSRLGYRVGCGWAAKTISIDLIGWDFEGFDLKLEVINQRFVTQPRGLGFGVWGLGFGVWGLGFGVWGLGFGVWGWGFGVWGLGCGVSCLWIC
jgi:hypothetical protein